MMKLLSDSSLCQKVIQRMGMMVQDLLFLLLVTVMGKGILREVRNEICKLV